MEVKNFSRLQELVTSARKALAAGDRTDARQYAETLIAEFPKSEEGWLVLASISNPEEALIHLENALRVNPGSQAARQGIRLVTSQILKEKKSVEEMPKKPVLEDTQPIKIIENEVIEVDSEVEFDEIDESDLSEAAQEFSDLKGEQVNTNEVVVEIESISENPVEIPMVEEFPATIPDTPTQKYDVPQGSDLDKQEPVSSANEPTAEKKFRFRKKPVEMLDRPEAESKNKPVWTVRTIRNLQSKTFDVEIIELLIIAGVAILLPVLVFLYFYFGK